MATLFFEGFEKGVILNSLDSSYWSSQFKRFPQYSFGGYVPYTDPSRSYYVNYASISPNNGILPDISYTNSYLNSNNGIYYPGNGYPGFGQPPGFLALTNVEVENPDSVEYPTYLQISGFPNANGNKTYFGFRSLGLESKHRDYSDYPHAHTLFSLCSGNITGLVVNVVKPTGNTLASLNNEKTTLALEIQQNNQSIGFFDLNISGVLSRYRVASVFSTGNKVLTIADTVAGNDINREDALITRWIHSEFLIDDSNPSQSYLSIKLEGTDLGIINNDIENRNDWDIELPISGFKFNNIKFYNRTYSSTLEQNITYGGAGGYYSWPAMQPASRYYLHGKAWLLDDITLIDNAGDPSFYVGPTAKILSFNPGYYTGGYEGPNLRDNVGETDGVLDWTSTAVVNDGFSFGSPTNPSPSTRKALLAIDNANVIESVTSGNIAAVNMNPLYLKFLNVSDDVVSYDPGSAWRWGLNDAVGGMKVYNTARKNYLDTKFINVFRSGVSDSLENNVSLLLHADSAPIVDSTKFPKAVNSNSVLVRGDKFKFGGGSLYFSNKDSSLSVSHPDLGNSPFTIEAWIYFQNHSQIVALFDKTPANWPLKPYENTTYEIPGQGTFQAPYYSFAANTSGIIFKNRDYCDKILPFDAIAETGVWNHVAISRTSDSNLVCYLNGIKGNLYNVCNCDSQLYLRTNEYQGTSNDIYSLNTLYSSNLTSVYNLTIGKPRTSLLKDSYYNNVSLLLKSENSAITDYSSNPKTISNSGVVLSYDHSIFGDRSLKLTNSSYLSCNNSSDFNFGSDNFTIEFWVYLGDPNPTNFTQRSLFSSNSINIDFRRTNTNDCTGNNGSTYGMLVYVLDSQANAYYLTRGCSGTWWQNIGNPYYAWDQLKYPWVHISIVRINGMMYAYVNGSTAIGNSDPIAYSANIPFNIDVNNFTLGSSSPGNSLNCYLDNFRITKGIARYATRANSFSPPYQPFGTNVTIPTDPGAFIDDYRITYGANRYTDNFTPPDYPLRAERDDYYDIGPVHNVNKTTYRNYQYYSYKNPATNQNWTMPQINNLIFGVKKL